MSRNSNQETDAYNNHLAFSQTLLADQYKCTTYPEHGLINWFSGDPPSFAAPIDSSAAAESGR